MKKTFLLFALTALILSCKGQQLVNIGSAPNDGTGDTPRAAFMKVNENFTEVYILLGSNNDSLTYRYMKFANAIHDTSAMIMVNGVMQEAEVTYLKDYPMPYFVLPPSSAPANPVNGTVYNDATLGLRRWDGTNWVAP